MLKTIKQVFSYIKTKIVEFYLSQLDEEEPLSRRVVV